MIPYGRQSIDENDIKAVVDVLRSDWLTTGPKVNEFEQAFASFVGAKHAVAVSSGTAALHCVTHCVGIGPGDEVIVTPMTFAASVNCVLYQSGTPVFADVNSETLLIDPYCVEKKVTERTKAIIAVDYAGQPCDYERLHAIAAKHGLVLIADACHSLGATYRGRRVGTLADLSVFSFHPVKHITTAEGGMVTTDDPEMARRIRVFRNHGITTDHRERSQNGSWIYEMVELGYNYRITDVQCALGLSQLKKLPHWLNRRREIACRYDESFKDLPGMCILGKGQDLLHAYHLYVVRIGSVANGMNRTKMFQSLRDRGVGANVHYVPVHLHPYYRTHMGTAIGLCPVAESAYEEILSLPMYPGMTDRQIDTVISVCRDLLGSK